MKVPMCVAKSMFGRGDYDKTRVQPASAGKFSYPIPFQKQVHANMCGDACVHMMGQFHGFPVNINMRDNPRGAFSGLDENDITQSYPLHVRATPNSAAGLRQMLSTHGPLMCSGAYCRMGVLGDQGHWVVLKGYDQQSFYIHDPWHGPNTPWDQTSFVNALETVISA